MSTKASPLIHTKTINIKVDAMIRKRKKVDLTKKRLSLMKVLVGGKRGFSQSQLSKISKRSLPTISKDLKILEKMRVVARKEVKGKDRGRLKFIWILTPEGIEKLRELQKRGK